MKKIKKKNNRAKFSGIPLQQSRSGVMKKRRALRSSKHQMDEALSRIFIHLYCKLGAES